MNRPSPDTRLQGKRILLVEDNALTVSFFRKALARAGVELIVVETLLEARRTIPERKYDMAVIDLQLPDGNGRSLIPLLHKHGIPTTVCTAEMDSNIPEKQLILKGRDLGLNLCTRLLEVLYPNQV